MNRNIKYKQVCSIGLFGDDDANTTTNSQYNVFPSSIPAITVINGGSNYTAAATTIFLLNDNNTGFLATPTISGGVITSITINNAGSKYEYSKCSYSIWYIKYYKFSWWYWLY